MEQVILDNFKELEGFISKLNLNFTSKDESLSEVEIKEKCDDVIFEMLKNAGFEYKETKYERNFLYDFKEQECKKAGIVCRVRRERNLSTGLQNILVTLKKKVETEDEFKEHIELEASVVENNLEALDDALNESSLSAVFVYEKFRHTFKIEDIDVEVCVDMLPLIGRFIEIEGKREAITKACNLLGIDNKNLQKSSYISLLKSNNKGNGREYRFSQYEAFLTAEKEIMLIDNYWHSCQGGSCSSCHSCGGSCHSCGK